MKTRLQLKRDSGFADFGRKYSIVLDGKVIGLIKNGGSFGCDISSGPHSLELKVDWCGSNVVQFEANEGSQVDLECGSSLRGWKIFRAERVAKEAPSEWIWLKMARRVESSAA